MATSRSQVVILSAAMVLLLGLSLLAGCHDEAFEVRRARVEALSPEAKEELTRRYETYVSLSPAEQTRLHQLNQQLERDPQAEKLREVMHRYNRWVNQLSQDLPYESSVLLELPPAERVQRVRALQQERARRSKAHRTGTSSSPERMRLYINQLGSQGVGVNRRANEEDLQTLQPWLTEWLVQHEADIQSHLPEPLRQRVEKLLASTSEAPQRLPILATAWLRLQWQLPLVPPPVSESEKVAMLEQLPAETRKRLKDRLEPMEIRRLLSVWQRLAALYLVLQHPVEQLPLVEEEELVRFLVGDAIASTDRDRLLNIPPAEAKRELLLTYLRWRIQEDRTRQQQSRPAGKRP